MTPEEDFLHEFSADEVDLLLQTLFKMKDANSKQKYLICNKPFNNIFKQYVIAEDAKGYKVTLDSIAGFQYIVSPYIKEQEKPSMYLCEIDLNKICGVNSVYEGTTLFIEDFLFNNIKQEWKSEPKKEQLNSPSESVAEQSEVNQ